MTDQSADLNNKSISNEGVCITAPATPGLLTRSKRQLISIGLTKIVN